MEKAQMEEVKRKRAPYERPTQQVGKGIPKYFLPIIEKRRQEKETITEDFSVPTSVPVPQSEFIGSKPGDGTGGSGGPGDGTGGPGSKNEQAGGRGGGDGIDVTVLDRYSDEIRRYRKLLIEECRNLPSVVTSDTNLVVLEDIIQKLCRNAYYGTKKAQKLAEGVLPLLVWLMNRKIFPQHFVVHVLKCVSEMCWTSPGLKSKFHNSHGTQVLYRHMTHLPEEKRIACWSCYCLAMIATGSAEMIIGAREIIGMEELVAELSFEYYWHDWPVNFGMVLQGLLYGPDYVSQAEEIFQYQSPTHDTA